MDITVSAMILGGIIFVFMGGILYPNNIGVYYAVKKKPKTKREIVALWMFFIGLTAWAIGIVGTTILSLL
ncbi:MAG: hypothetical protein A2418_00345 [Candidatus Brennerbacteria bacterium RIFOXYC1_FULL_41_11]|uniref:Uncharacterized protein n=1 Tax=Candidatus Brennerbacteria bacterium RIFOXYD1_FULL_41_16 TaxID=1797529 RepID=A0A1G1XL25_9BACT|nr:MAG: hypothetical protein UU61_C0005G0017 [Parcubacteria group bacterium GW2011_GWB1_41_4]OGY39284.1 MAG: hypothetical protein A2391_01805 [Candidatus Brennerbacteria bacterium RIFOXYB1_FULL_41_13]OGY39686.1 MAG: hypothetical protein A2418_00345 [Candidatus Brennerbacteria bacterium RIFOXYC1_FULL_41_11]OGY40310.1 MAG: hypothetical protein A2570_03470 [Candidatus Brennerbacteria bacterium RIFOXYD1_FULL_41_16]